jgi:hypothetical protein
MPGLDFPEAKRRKRAEEGDSKKATVSIIPAKLVIQPNKKP